MFNISAVSLKKDVNVETVDNSKSAEPTYLLDLSKSVKGHIHKKYDLIINVYCPFYVYTNYFMYFNNIVYLLKTGGYYFHIWAPLNEPTDQIVKKYIDNFLPLKKESVTGFLLNYYKMMQLPFSLNSNNILYVHTIAQGIIYTKTSEASPSKSSRSTSSTTTRKSFLSVRTTKKRKSMFLVKV